MFNVDVEFGSTGIPGEMKPDGTTNTTREMSNGVRTDFGVTTTPDNGKYDLMLSQEM